MQPPDWPNASQPPDGKPLSVQVSRCAGQDAGTDTERGEEIKIEIPADLTGEIPGDSAQSNPHWDQQNSTNTAKPSRTLMGMFYSMLLKILQWRWAPWFSRWNSLKQTYESITKAEFSRRTWIAYVVAVCVDGLQIGLAPALGTGILLPVNIVLDAATTIVMTRLLGFHIAFIPTFAMEFVPVVEIAPTWTLAVWIATQQFSPVDKNSTPLQPK